MPKEFEELHSCLKANSLKGKSPIKPTREFLVALAKETNRSEIAELAKFNFEEDLKKIEENFLSLFSQFPPPSNLLVYLLWFIGAGPDYPLGFSGCTTIPLPLKQEWIEDYPLLGDFCWEPPEPASCIYSSFLEKSCALFQETFEEENFGDLGDNYELDDEVLMLFGEYLISYLAVKYSNIFLQDADERYILYGFHGEGDILVAGKLSKEKGWESIREILTVNL